MERLKVSNHKSGHRRYLVESLERIVAAIDDRPVILYARVSTASQKDDLASQIEYLGKNYPNCKCISDYGSGLNFKREKFVSLMEQVLKQEIKTVVVAHKDRLCRFGYYLVNGFVMPIDVTLLFLTIPTNHRTKN